MAGQSNNVNSTVGSADLLSSPPSPEVPATPKRAKGPLRCDSAARRQMSSPTLSALQSGSPDLQVTPTPRRFPASYETCSPLHYSTQLSAFTPIPLNFDACSFSHVPDTPLSIRGRGPCGAKALSYDPCFEVGDQWATVCRTLFMAPPPSPRENSFPSSPDSSSTASGLPPGSDDDITVECTVTGTPFGKHICCPDGIPNCGFCRRTP